jgi:hypothetical protein
MTDLSPAAQAVWAAYLDHSEIDETPADLPALVVAIKALADQVVPEEVRVRKAMRPGGIGSTTPTEWMQDQRLHVRRQLLAIAAELKGTLAQPEPQRLTVQECNDMRKHGENYICESRDGKEIQLDGCFTREDLIELANTQPTTH